MNNEALKYTGRDLYLWQLWATAFREKEIKTVIGTYAYLKKYVDIAPFIVALK